MGSLVDPGEVWQRAGPPHWRWGSASGLIVALSFDFLSVQKYISEWGLPETIHLLSLTFIYFFNILNILNAFVIYLFQISSIGSIENCIKSWFALTSDAAIGVAYALWRQLGRPCLSAIGPNCQKNVL